MSTKARELKTGQNIAQKRDDGVAPNPDNPQRATSNDSPPPNRSDEGIPRPIFEHLYSSEAVAELSKKRYKKDQYLRDLMLILYPGKPHDRHAEEAHWVEYRISEVVKRLQAEVPAGTPPEEIRRIARVISREILIQKCSLN